MTATTTADLHLEIKAAAVEALRSVDDPEYPGLSILDLGIVEQVTADANDVGGSHVTVGLIPTFSGCPALDMIASDVESALAARPEITSHTVEWLSRPVWSTDRLTDTGRRRLAEGYTVVIRSADGSLHCPVCGSRGVKDQSLAGPARCRSIAWCDDCRNAVEVMR